MIIIQGRIPDGLNLVDVPSIARVAQCLTSSPESYGSSPFSLWWPVMPIISLRGICAFLTTVFLAEWLVNRFSVLASGEFAFMVFMMLLIVFTPNGDFLNQTFVVG